MGIRVYHTCSLFDQNVPFSMKTVLNDPNSSSPCHKATCYSEKYLFPWKPPDLVTLEPQVHSPSIHSVQVDSVIHKNVSFPRSNLLQLLSAVEDLGLASQKHFLHLGCPFLIVVTLSSILCCLESCSWGLESWHTVGE